MDWRGEWWLRSPVLQQRSKQDTSPRGVCRCSPESQTPRSWHSPGESYIYPWMVANWTSFPIAFFNSIFRLMFYPDRKTHKLPPLEFHKADSRGSFCFNITRFQMPWNAIVIPEIYKSASSLFIPGQIPLYCELNEEKREFKTFKSLGYFEFSGKRKNVSL